MINYWNKYMIGLATLLTTSPTVAQTEHCRDTVQHARLRAQMWSSCQQDDPKVVYAACWEYQNHAKEDKDNEAYYDSWTCGIMFNLDRMNIHDAYHIAHTMKDDLVHRKWEAKDEQFMAPKMLGHVYNACGNIPGAEEELKKAIELIKGTKYEKDGLSFLYLAMAHIHLNNNLEETLKWIETDLEELERHNDQVDYWRCKADLLAMKAIVKFKQKDYQGFYDNYNYSEGADKRNPNQTGDLFLPYARVYKTLLDGNPEKALKDVEKLSNMKERYMLRCDIYRYTGNDDLAFLTQRELMHKRDSITGVMIAENIQKQEEEMVLLKNGQKAARIMNIVLLVTIVLALMLITGLAMTIYGKRRYQDMLLKKNNELKSAYKQVAAADEMKTEFIRSVSHEIRTPLNIINGFTQVLTDEGAELAPADRKSIADTISTNARHITSLVNKMLALANEHTKDILKEAEETDALDICRRAIAGMPNVDTSKVKIELDDQTEGENKKIVTNSDSLLQMLSNILENAAKFTEQGYIRLTMKKDKTHIHFTVEDTGCGIPQDKINTIFKRFVKVDNFKEGLGLGLAYCRETVEKLGGTLTLDKTSEAGTSFTLSLPIKLKTKE